MTTHREWLFGSLFIGGFECATQLTMDGRRLDIITASQHDKQAREDYQRCRQLGLCVVREAVRWPFVETQPGVYQLDAVRQLARLGREMGLVQIWDLMHYGYPADLDPLSYEFAPRFAAYTKAVAEVIRAETTGQTWYTPINEISYYSWAGGEVGYMAPFLQGRGDDLKRALVRAAVQGLNAIWQVDPDAGVITVDPLVRIHPPDSQPERQPEADFFNQYVVQEANEMLAGRIAPELGGSRRHLGIVGINYYAVNQWTIATDTQASRVMTRDDAAWLPLSTLLRELQDRYGGPLVIAETGASGNARADWLRHLSSEVQQARTAGVDLQGICLYPIITTPDWEDPTAFFDGGIFDVRPESDGTLRRVLIPVVAAALREAQLQLDPANAASLSQTVEDMLPSGTAQLTHAADHVQFKADNFSYQTLISGEQLTVDLYCIRGSGSLPTHRYPATEQVWLIMEGAGIAHLGEQQQRVQQGDTLLIPAGLYHSLANDTTQPLILQRIATPKPFDANYGAVHPPTSLAASMCCGIAPIKLLYTLMGFGEA